MVKIGLLKVAEQGTQMVPSKGYELVEVRDLEAQAVRSAMLCTCHGNAKLQ